MRKPCVAGQFYSGNPDELKEQIRQCFLGRLGPGTLPGRGDEDRDILGCVSPHAGYMYSGSVAAHVYFELSKQKTPETIVIISPNHTGVGGTISLSSEDWETPLGTVETNREIVEELSKNCAAMDIDESSHNHEHSLEVQLPFLQTIYGDFKMVPICVKGIDSAEIEEASSHLSKIEGALIIASSDFTHYEPHDITVEKDKSAIKHIIEMDEERFLQKVYERGLSICGYGPIALCIATAKKMGAMKAELLKYSTSGEVTGDMGNVVGYAGIVMRG